MAAAWVSPSVESLDCTKGLVGEHCASHLGHCDPHPGIWCYLLWFVARPTTLLCWRSAGEQQPEDGRALGHASLNPDFSSSEVGIGEDAGRGPFSPSNPWGPRGPGSQESGESSGPPDTTFFLSRRCAYIKALPSAHTFKKSPRNRAAAARGIRSMSLPAPWASLPRKLDDWGAAAFHPPRTPILSLDAEDISRSVVPDSLRPYASDWCCSGPGLCSLSALRRHLSPHFPGEAGVFPVDSQCRHQGALPPWNHAYFSQIWSNTDGKKKRRKWSRSVVSDSL